MKFTTTISLLLLTFNSIAQLSGKISTSLNEPIDYCKLTLYKDSLAVQTVFLDSIGAYQFNNISSGSYLLKISVPFQKLDTLIFVNGPTLFDLKLDASQMVSAVVVSAKKPKVVQLVDHMVFDPANIPILRGASALDVIEFAPGVFVKGGNIVLANGTTCLLALNGRLLNLTNEALTSFISSIQTEDIKNIEVYQIMPVKYASNNNGGLVNIVLRTGAKSRVSNGSIGANTRKGILFNEGLSANYSYRKNRFSLYSNASVSATNYRYDNSSTIETPTTIWTENKTSYLAQTALNGGLGLNYALSPKTEIGVLFVSDQRTNQLNSNGTSDILNLPFMGLSSIKAESAHISEIRKNALTFSVQQQLDTNGKQLSFIVDLSALSNQRQLDYSNLYLSWGLDSVSARQNRTNNTAQFISAGLDFNLPFDQINITTGLNFSKSLNGNSLKVFNINGVQSTLDQNLSNQFEFEEQILAGYISANKNYDKWGYSLSCRAEYTLTSGLQATSGQLTKYNYPLFSPQAILIYKPINNLNLRLSYNLVNIRPDFTDLNPFKVYSNAYSFYQGNPYLKANAIHVLSLNCNYQDWIFGISYNRTNNLMNSITVVDSLTLMQQTTIANFQKSQYATVFASYDLFDYKRWNCNAVIRLSHSIVQSTVPEVQIGTIRNFSADVMLDLSYGLDKKNTFFISTSISYGTPWIQEFQRQSNMPDNFFSLKKSFLQNRLFASISVNDPFKIQRLKVTSLINNVRQTGSTYYDTQAVSARLSYHFGNRNISVNKNASNSTGQADRYKTE
jgi:hypothetical protein